MDNVDVDKTHWIVLNPNELKKLRDTNPEMDYINTVNEVKSCYCMAGLMIMVCLALCAGWTIGWVSGFGKILSIFGL